MTLKSLTDEKYLHPEEADRLAQFLAGEFYRGRAEGVRVPTRNGIAFRTALSLGLRASEIVNLKHEHVHLGQHPNVRIVNSKRGKSRTLMLAKKMVQPLKEWISFSEDWTKCWLFPNRTGEQWARNSAWQSWSQCLKQAGIRHVPLHGARHTAALRMYRQSKDLRSVQKVLGHSNIQTTTIYAYVLEEDIRAMMDEIEWVL